MIQIVINMPDQAAIHKGTVSKAEFKNGFLKSVRICAVNIVQVQ